MTSFGQMEYSKITWSVLVRIKIDLDNLIRPLKEAFLPKE